MMLLHSPEQLEIQKAGTRVLMCVEPPEVLTRMFPRPSLRPRVEAGGARLERARQVRVTNPSGTDITYALGNYKPILQYGYTDQKGRWDHFAGGFVYTWPNEGESNGKIVLRAGDIIFPFKEFLRSEIEITVNHDGRAYDLGSAYGHVAIGVTDLDATLAALAGRGIEPERPPYTVSDGGARICFVTEPAEGYRFELVETG